MEGIKHILYNKACYKTKKTTKKGRDMCIHIADLLCCTAESNTTLESNYTLIKK